MFWRKKKSIPKKRKAPTDKKTKFKSTGKAFIATTQTETFKAKSNFEEKISRIFFSLTTIVILALACYYLIFSSLLRINKVVIKTPTRIKKELIKQEVRPFLQGAFLKYFNRDHFLFINRGAIEKHLLQTFPSFEDVRVKKSLFKKIEIEIIEKQIQLNMCGDFECIAIDQQGTVIARFSKDNLFKYSNDAELIIDKSNQLALPGHGVNTADFVKAASQIREKLNQKLSINARGVYVPLAQAPEIQVATNKNYLLIFNSKDPLNDQLQALKVILENEIQPQDLDCLEYLDLRVQGKVFYKFHDDCRTEAQESEQEAVAS
ncbi:MAG: hypothetical protein GF332_02785 [Candidatus Moranbacteria bacterium]|nr:hypothetical protein [Candidatus Moranbacteria bacterium]